MMIDLRLDITFHADWRFGSGLGAPGGEDRACHRDEDGLPFVGGKMLAGLFRDAAEMLSAGLRAPWPANCRAVFGARPQIGADDPGARLASRPARLPESLRAVIGGSSDPLLRQSLFGSRAAVRLTDAGLPVDKHLRFDEVTGALALTAPWELDVSGLDEAQVRAALALLQATAVFVDRAGAARQRGLGRCTVTVEAAGVETPEPAEVLRILEDAPAIPPLRQKTAARRRKTDDVDDVEALVRLDLTARTPLLLAPTRTGNASVSRDVVPGTMLLPVVTRAIDGALGDGTTLDLIRGGRLRVGNGTPTHRGALAVPVPMSWSRYKDGGGLREDHGVLNRFAGDEAQDGRQPKGLRGGWVVPGDDQVRLPPEVTVGVTTCAHAAIDPERQRPTSATGGLFSYTAVREGTSFAAFVTVRGRRVADALAAWADAAPAQVRLGTSKKDDYGRASLRVSAWQDERRDRLDPSTGAQRRLAVLLASDFVLRDGAGAPRTDPTAVADALVVAFARAGVTGLELRPSGAVPPASRAVRREGWKTEWNLPRETVVALETGSCFLMDVTGAAIPTDALEAVERWGIGELRAEGYGAVRLNDPLLVRSTVDRLAAPRLEQDATAAPMTLDRHAAAMLRSTEVRAWRTAITVAVTANAHAFKVLLPDEGRATSSQLGRLRRALRHTGGAAAGILALFETEEDAQLLKERGWRDAEIQTLRFVAEHPDARDLWDPIFAAAPALADSSSGAIGSLFEAQQRHHDYALAAALTAAIRVARTPRSMPAGEGS